MSGGGCVLRSVNRFAALNEPHGFAQSLAAERGKSAEQFSRSIVFADGDAFLQKDIPGVHLFHGAHDRHARFLIAVEHRPLYRGRAAVFRQQRSVNIDHPFRENGEKLVGKDLPERGGHAEIGFKRGDCFQPVARHLFELQYGNAEFGSSDFQRRRCERVSSSDGFVRSGDDCRDIVFRGERGKHFRRKIRRPHENYFQSAHSSFRSLHLEV